VSKAFDIFRGLPKALGILHLGKALQFRSYNCCATDAGNEFFSTISLNPYIKLKFDMVLPLETGSFHIFSLQKVSLDSFFL
jgi:hypothetical protein